MKILIATDNYYPNVNGASYFAQRLARELQDRHHKVLVLAPGQSIKSGYFTHKGVRVFGVRSIPIIKKIQFRQAVPFSQLTIWPILKDFKPDIIHVQDHFSLGHSAAYFGRYNNIPVIGTNHFMPENLTHYLHVGSTIEKKVNRLFWQYFLAIYQRLDAVTVPTQAAADLLRSIGFSKEIKVISNGIDLHKFSPKEDDYALRKKYHIPNGKILLYTGRIDKEKNLDTVIKALAKLPSDFSIHFVAIGQGMYQNNLQLLINKLGVAGKVTFTGFVPDEDFPYLLATAYCFISPGIAELQSIATMEAMANALPILAANAVALPELVHNDINGFLFEPYDEISLANYIKKIFTNEQLHDRLAEGSLQIIKTHDMHQVITQFEKLYEFVIRKKNKFNQ